MADHLLEKRPHLGKNDPTSSEKRSPQRDVCARWLVRLYYLERSTRSKARHQRAHQPIHGVAKLRLANPTKQHVAEQPSSKANEKLRRIKKQNK